MASPFRLSKFSTTLHFFKFAYVIIIFWRITMKNTCFNSNGELCEVRVETAMLGGKPITVEHLTPILTPKERERRKREIERILYNVFIKYEKNSPSSN